jgi:hypothetical protein
MNENSLRDHPIDRVRKEMEVITADGRCAGHVSECVDGQIFMLSSAQPIPEHWIRRVDGEEVYISKRWYELVH